MIFRYTSSNTCLGQKVIPAATCAAPAELAQAPCRPALSRARLGDTAVPSSGGAPLEFLLRLPAAGLLELPQPRDGLRDGALSVDLIVSGTDVDSAAGFLLFTHNQDEVILR